MTVTRTIITVCAAVLPVTAMGADTPMSAQEVENADTKPSVKEPPSPDRAFFTPSV